MSFNFDNIKDEKDEFNDLILEPLKHRLIIHFIFDLSIYQIEDIDKTYCYLINLQFLYQNLNIKLLNNKIQISLIFDTYQLKNVEYSIYKVITFLNGSQNYKFNNFFEYYLRTIIIEPEYSDTTFDFINFSLNILGAKYLEKIEFKRMNIKYDVEMHVTHNSFLSVLVKTDASSFMLKTNNNTLKFSKITNILNYFNNEF